MSVFSERSPKQVVGDWEASEPGPCRVAAPAMSYRFGAARRHRSPGSEPPR